MLICKHGGNLSSRASATLGRNAETIITDHNLVFACFQTCKLNRSAPPPPSLLPVSTPSPSSSPYLSSPTPHPISLPSPYPPTIPHIPSPPPTPLPPSSNLHHPHHSTYFIPNLPLNTFPPYPPSSYLFSLFISLYLFPINLFALLFFPFLPTLISFLFTYSFFIYHFFSFTSSPNPLISFPLFPFFIISLFHSSLPLFLLSVSSVSPSLSSIFLPIPS